MSPRPRLNRRVGRSLALAFALAALLPAAAAAAVLGPKDAGPLSPPLAVLAKPSVAAKSPAAQADLLGIANEGPASLVREGDRVVVTARFADGAIARLPALRAAGARVLSASREQQTVTLAVAPADLLALADIAGVRSVWPQRQPIVYASNCEGGAVVSEGLEQLRVDDARAAFELRGKGLTVGVISDSFDTASKAATHASEDVAAGDLPGPANTCSEQQLPVNVLADTSGSDEGRAMLQIVHDLAPHAALAFATAFISEESFTENIERLAEPVSAGGAGAEVIVDDVAYFEEPFFQDGPVAVAIDNVVAGGVSYLSAAGNDNLFETGNSNEIASWEAPSFRDSGGCPEAIANLNPVEFNGSHCMDFDPGGGTDRTFGITVEAGRTLTLDLQWAEPWHGVATDLDAFLLSEAGKTLTASVALNVGPTGTQRPVEIFQWKNTAGTPRTVQLAVNRFAGSNPRLKFILLQNGGGVSATEYPKSSGGDVVGPTIFGHAGAASAIAVAAVPFDDSAEPEPYSSRGPVTHYFGPVEGVTPAPPLGSPEVVAKPDLAATDCGATTFFASLSAGVWRFCGTSAAAPHAAGVMALMAQAAEEKGGGLEGPEPLRAALLQSASPVGAFGACAVGAGLVETVGAVEALLAGPEPLSPLDCTQPSSSLIVDPPPPLAATGSVLTPTPPPPAPDTLILRRPPKLVRTHLARARVVFRFGSDQAGVTFLCKVDRGLFGRCNARIVRRLAPGRHVLKVKARNAGGLVDSTPAVFRFRIERI